MERSPRSSRIAAARARAGRAKLVLVFSATLAFFTAVALERGPVARSSNRSSQSSVSQASSQSQSFFGSGSIAPAQQAPSTSTGTS